jgi:D-tyrosyl-tRNA(Tyr) deacylase
MIALLQRVTSAAVDVDGATIARIGRGLLILVGVERDDGLPEAARLAQRLLAYRVFPDDAGRMNRSVRDVGGAVLLVPQFTLAADTASGTRPGFSHAAEPAVATELFGALHRALAASGLPAAVGRFGADMQVSLTNDGPVTFWLRVAPRGGA